MEKALGSEGKLKMEMVGGKIKISVEYDGKQVDGGMYLMSDSDLLVDALMGLIPGNSQFEQAAGAVLKMSLKAVTV